MKLSAWVSSSDLLGRKASGFGEFIFSKFIKQDVFSENDPKEALKTLKNSGVNGVELLVSSGTKNDDIQKIKKILKEVDLKIFSVHQSISKLFNISIEEVEELFGIAKDLSAGVVVLHINVIGDKIFDKDYVKSLKDLQNKYGIKIGIENSPITPLTLFKTYTWKEDEFCSVVDKAGFNITFDTTHLAQTGKDIINFYKKNKKRIVNIHLSDYKKNFLNTHFLLTYDTHLPLAAGTSPVKQFVKTLKKNRYDGIITMEINGNLSQLCKSAKLIKSIYDDRA